MAAAGQSLRFSLRSSSRNASQLFYKSLSPSLPAASRRAFSATTRWRADDTGEGAASSDNRRQTHFPWKDEYDAWEQEMEERPRMLHEIRKKLMAEKGLLPPDGAAEPSFAELETMEKVAREAEHDLLPFRRTATPRANAFWNEDEDDGEIVMDEMGEEDFDEDDIPAMAHGKLEEQREYREYARIAVWEMPLLSKLAKPFEKPKRDQPLRFRYTSYMGEYHPAEKKVVVQFTAQDLPLTPAEQLKLKKLVGPRYNPETEIIKISCEMFEHQAQNKRYLGDLVAKLIAEAKDDKDTFEDIPLDTRHHVFKEKPKFPREWRMTAARRKQLQDIRQQGKQLDDGKRDEGTLIDGVQCIQFALNPPSENRKMGEMAHELVPNQSRIPEASRLRR